MYIYIYTCTYIYTCIYIHIYQQNERKQEKKKKIFNFSCLLENIFNSILQLCCREQTIWDRIILGESHLS